MKSRAFIEPDEMAWRLRVLASEVQAVGSLLKWQQPQVEFNDSMREGVGEILEKLGARVQRLSLQVENYSLKK